MPAHILRQLLRDRIESLLPEGALEIAKVAEDSERDYLERMAEILKQEAA
jgi:siroheme synthase (precorrin-2 oxidase/ferrochelatase)